MGNTAQEIYNRMAADLKNMASKMPGSFTADNLLSVSNELARLYSMEYDRLIDRAHITTAKGADLDRAALENHGMTRLEASYEEVNVTIIGMPGTLIDSTMGVKADDNVYMFTGDYTVGADGTVEVSARCTEAGAGHTAAAGAVNQFLETYAGLESVTNEQMSSGGYDAETDKDFVNRILDSEKAVAGYGNIAWYRAAAKKVAGVSKAKVFDLARGRGTVDVVIIARNNTEASEVLVKRVAEYIEANRVPGADVLVQSGVALAIQTTASVYLDDGYSISSVQSEFFSKLQQYLDNMEFKNTSERVSHAKVVDLLINCGGVLDIGSLTLNGEEASIVLGARNFPVASEPQLIEEV